VDLGEDEKKKAKTIQSMVPPPSLLAESLLASIHSRPRSVSFSSIQLLRSSIAASRLAMRPGLEHRVIWEVLSSGWPQLGQMFLTDGSIFERSLFVPQKCETCFEIQNLNVSGNFDTAFSIPSQ